MSCPPVLQVLLQLNIAYYLPSIPVLLLFGQVEKLLDAEFGQTASMAMRLMAGAKQGFRGLGGLGVDLSSSRHTLSGCVQYSL